MTERADSCEGRSEVTKAKNDWNEPNKKWERAPNFIASVGDAEKYK
jgi:hypothetical protein